MPDELAQLASLPLTEAPLAFVDVETTGLNAWLGDRVCEIAVVRCFDGVEVARLSTFVNPLRPLSAGAFRVNGIAPAMLAGAPTFQQIARSVREAVEGCVLVAHNAPFDLSFLCHEMALAGEPPLRRVPVVDTLALARRSRRFARNSLSAVAVALGVRAPGHRALADALTTREVLEGMLARLLPRGATVSEVIRQQGGPITWPVASAPPIAAAHVAGLVASGRGLRIVYRSADGRETERRVEPIELIQSGDSVELVAYCHLRGEQRTFRLDRVVKWEVDEPPSALSSGL